MNRIRIYTEMLRITATILTGEALLSSGKEKYISIMEGKAGKAEYASALKFLSDYLKKYNEKNVIILIDEYDVPLENAYFTRFSRLIA